MCFYLILIFIDEAQRLCNIPKVTQTVNDEAGGETYTQWSLKPELMTSRPRASQIQLPAPDLQPQAGKPLR